MVHLPLQLNTLPKKGEIGTNSELDRKSTLLALYLHSILEEECPDAGDYPVELPSLLGMAGQLNCTHLIIYDALRKLLNVGYQYALAGLDDPIRIFRTEA